MDRRSSEVEQRRFDVRRKGYDQAEVTVYLQDIAETMAELEAAARAAELALTGCVSALVRGLGPCSNPAALRTPMGMRPREAPRGP